MTYQQLNNVHDNIINNLKDSLAKNPDVSELYNSLLYYFDTKGKMLRPSIMLTVAKDIGSDLEAVSEFATGLEMIHNYSLIHDDLPAMDNDDYRRGKLTIHKKYSESTAILAGDYLLNESFNYILNSQGLQNVQSDRVISALAYLSKKSNSIGMLGGQIMDLDNSLLDNETKLLKMYELKTSALFECATTIPAILSGIDPESLSSFENIGRIFGIVFQILDDIDDYEQDKIIDKVNIFSFRNKEEIDELILELKIDLKILLVDINLPETQKLLSEYLGEI